MSEINLPKEGLKLTHAELFRLQAIAKDLNLFDFKPDVVTKLLNALEGSHVEVYIMQDETRAFMELRCGNIVGPRYHSMDASLNGLIKLAPFIVALAGGASAPEPTELEQLAGRIRRIEEKLLLGTGEVG